MWQAAAGIESTGGGAAAGRSTVPQAESSSRLVTQRRMDGIEGLWKQLAAANLTSLLHTESLAQELLPLLASSPSLGLPPSLKTALFPTPSSSSFTPRSGCNDAFSVFAFLAFLLALLQLMQDMARRRRKRGAEEGAGELVCQERGREAAIAAHTMFQGRQNIFPNYFLRQAFSMQWTTVWRSVQPGRSARQEERQAREAKWEVSLPGMYSLPSSLLRFSRFEKIQNCVCCSGCQVTRLQNG